MTNMNPEVKKLWTAALRSCQYLQGKGYLKYQPPGDGKARYCCLGVLCELSPIEGRAVTGDPDSTVTEFDGLLTYLPESVQVWAGVGSANPKVRYEGLEQSLADINDARNATFAEIADLIDAQL